MAPPPPPAPSERTLDLLLRRIAEMPPHETRARKDLCRAAVAAARTLGRVTPGTCAAFAGARGVCKGRLEAHHEDYTQPLSVVWLCRRHHALLTKLTTAWRRTWYHAGGTADGAAEVPYDPVTARRHALALLRGEVSPAPTDRAWTKPDAWERRERRELRARRTRTGRKRPDATEQLTRQLARRRARENPPHILQPPVRPVRRRPKAVEGGTVDDASVEREGRTADAAKGDAIAPSGSSD